VLEATSAGRIIGIFLWPQKMAGEGTKQWIKAVGVRDVKIAPEYISAGREQVVDEHKLADAEQAVEEGDATVKAHTLGISGADIPLEGEGLLKKRNLVTMRNATL
jgi:hypothetical protein